MFCALSGQAPREAVVAKATGLVFEKRLLEKYLAEHGVCPVTKQALGADDLVEVKASATVAPRPAASASVPGLLASFHNEWDALMLEQHALREKLHATQQELAQALYQHDAATRVVARLLKERDEARAALASGAAAPVAAPAAAPAAPAAGKRPAEDAEMSEAGGKKARGPAGGLPSEVVAALDATNKQLSATRRKRPLPEGQLGSDAIGTFALASTHPLHKTTAKEGILDLDVKAGAGAGGADLVATAGADSKAVLFDRGAGTVVGKLEGHGKKVTSVRFVPGAEVALTASADKTVRVWSGAPGAMECAATLKDAAAEVTALSVHPTGGHFAAADTAGVWRFYDLEGRDALLEVEPAEAGDAYACASFHPDGLLLGAGTQGGLLRLWDVKSQKNVVTLEGHTGSVTGLNFSENGYLLVSRAADGARVWDLRKPAESRNVKSLAREKHAKGAVAFDLSGQYLAVGDAAGVSVLATKQEYGVLAELPGAQGARGGAKDLHALRFGPAARYLLAASADHNLRVYAPAEPAA